MNIFELGSISSPRLLFGGAYSNLQATRALIEETERREIPPDQVICTGDIVAYCGDPQETTTTIREWGCHVVMGNCEESIAFDKQDCGCGFEKESLCASLSVDWYSLALQQVTPENKLWMRGLPRQINFSFGTKHFAVIHGSIDNISEFIFDSSSTSRKRASLLGLEVDCVVGGHCGIPFGQSIGSRYWLNPGAIGMPANDGKSNTWYMLLQSFEDKIRASWHTLRFDTRETVRAMSARGLPVDYQATLENGLWPSMSALPEISARRQGIPLHPPALLVT